MFKKYKILVICNIHCKKKGGGDWNASSIILYKNNKYPQLCPTQGRVEGWDAMKPRYYRSVSSKGAGRPRLTHHHKGWWNETKWMRWVWRSGWNEICGRGKREKPREKPIYFLIQHNLKSDQLRYEFQEITSHHGVAVANGWIKTTSLPLPSARGHCHKVATY